jgi:lysophospholipase L1-like esterase
MNKKLQRELENIQFSEIAGKNPSADNVTTDLLLYDGRNTAFGYADVSWRSSNAALVSPSGFVMCTEKTEKVTITASFTYQDYPDLNGEVSFEITVQPSDEAHTSSLPNTDKIRIFIAGDSTACDYPHTGENNRFPQTGWGQVFGELFNDKIEVVNCARSGRSSKSFLKEDNFKFICDNIRKGDYLFIQFAHNDCKSEDLQRYTSPSDGTYQKCIFEFINAARDVSANPVLCTSITRNLPEDNTLVPYGEALKKIAEDENIPLLDLYKETHENLMENGAEKSAKLHMHLQPHDARFADNPEFARSQYYESGSKDNTHLNICGARIVANIAADELKRINHSLVKYLI